MSRRKMNRREWVVVLMFFPALVFGQLFLRQRFGIFEVSIGIGVIFSILLWLVRDRDVRSESN